MVDGREEERDGEREGADCKLAAPSLEHALSFERGEDRDDRERGENHAVRESVDDAPPGDRGSKLQPVWVPGRRLALDDPGHHRDEREPDDDSAAPVTCQQLARGRDPEAQPGADEPEHRGDVHGVVQVAVDRRQVCQHERNRETEREPGGEPAPLTVARRNRGRMSARVPAAAAGCDDIHGCLLSSSSDLRVRVRSDQWRRGIHRGELRTSDDVLVQSGIQNGGTTTAPSQRVVSRPLVVPRSTKSVRIG